MTIASDQLLRGIARDEALTRGLGDVEGRMLVEWAVDWAELLASAARSDAESGAVVDRLRRRGRAIARFVQMWPRDPRGASQLAAAERFEWPLPAGAEVGSADLMEHILNWERAAA